MPITKKDVHIKPQTVPGSNWKALKNIIAPEPSSSVTPVKAKRSRCKFKGKGVKGLSPATTVALTSQSIPTLKLTGSTLNSKTNVKGQSLPWFAQDLQPHQIAAVVKGTAQELTSRSMQWEGVMDLHLKKQLILKGPPEGVPDAIKQPGHYLAVDCEMVGLGYKGSESSLARVSIVNFHGVVILDKFVKPVEKVTDYRTWVSGVRPKDLINAPSFSQVQDEVAALIKNRVLVGHAIFNDLKALMLTHPKPLIRDTASFQPLKQMVDTNFPSLKKLAKAVLEIDIQLKGKPHSSVEDARATMAVFRTQKIAWDEWIRTKGNIRSGRVGDKGEPAEPELSTSTTASFGTRRNPFANPIWTPPTAAAAVTTAAGKAKEGVDAIPTATPTQGKKRKRSAPTPAKPAKKPKSMPTKSAWWKEDL